MATNYNLPKPTAGTPRAGEEVSLMVDVSDTVADIDSRITGEATTRASADDALDTRVGSIEADYTTAAELGAAVDNATSVAAEALHVWGHSYAAGTGASDPARQGLGPVLADLLGLPLRNNANAGTSLASHVGGASNWVDVLQKTTRPTRFAPAGGCFAVMYGLNDLNQFGNTAAQMAGFKQALRAVVSRMRAGAVFEAPADPTITYPTGAWADLASTAENSGAGYRYTTGDATFAITTPAEFPGGTLAVGVTARANGSGATITATVNGIAYVLDAHNDQTAGHIPCVLRIPNVPPGSQTITFTVTDVVSLVGIDYWQWEPPTARCPVIALIAQPEPLDYTNYGSVAPGPPTDAGVAVLNAILAEAAAEFDERVVVADTSDLDDDPSVFVAGNVHPNAKGHRLIAEATNSAVRSVALPQARPPVTVRSFRIAADQALAASDTEVENVLGAKVPIGAYETLLVNMRIILASTSATPDYKLAITPPSGASGSWGVDAIISTATGLVGQVAKAALALGTTQVGLGSFAGTWYADVWASIANGPTAGYVRLQAAQNTSDPAVITVKAGSYGQAEVLAA